MSFYENLKETAKNISIAITYGTVSMGGAVFLLSHIKEYFNVMPYQGDFTYSYTYFDSDDLNRYFNLAMLSLFFSITVVSTFRTQAFPNNSNIIKFEERRKLIFDFIDKTIFPFSVGMSFVNNIDKDNAKNYTWPIFISSLLINIVRLLLNSEKSETEFSEVSFKAKLKTWLETIKRSTSPSPKLKTWLEIIERLVLPAPRTLYLMVWASTVFSVQASYEKKNQAAAWCIGLLPSSIELALHSRNPQKYTGRGYTIVADLLSGTSVALVGTVAVSIFIAGGHNIGPIAGYSVLIISGAAGPHYGYLSGKNFKSLTNYRELEDVTDNAEYRLENAGVQDEEMGRVQHLPEEGAQGEEMGGRVLLSEEGAQDDNDEVGGALSVRDVAEDIAVWEGHGSDEDEILSSGSHSSGRSARSRYSGEFADSDLSSPLLPSDSEDDERGNVDQRSSVLVSTAREETAKGFLDWMLPPFLRSNQIQAPVQSGSATQPKPRMCAIL